MAKMKPYKYKSFDCSELAEMTVFERKTFCAEYLADNTVSRDQLKRVDWILDTETSTWMDQQTALELATERSKRLAKRSAVLIAQQELKSTDIPVLPTTPKTTSRKKVKDTKLRVIYGNRISHELTDGLSTTDVKTLYSMLVNKEWIVEAYYINDEGIMQSKYYSLDEVTKELVRTDYRTWNCDCDDCKLCNVIIDDDIKNHEKCNDGVCKKCIARHDTCNDEDCKKCNPPGHEQVYGRIPYIDIRGSDMKGIKVIRYTLYKAEDFAPVPQLEGIAYLRPYDG